MGFDFGASAVNIGLQAYHDKQARKWQVDQTDKQYQRDIEQRDYQNTYNSPENQMERFKQAGLNPNLIYGKGTAGQQTSTVTASKPEGRWTKRQLNFGDPLDTIQKYQNYKKLRAETDLTSAATHTQNLKNQITEGTLATQINYEMERLRNLAAKTTNESQKRLYMEQMTELAKQKTRVEIKRAEWRERGFTETDPSWLRMGWEGLKSFGKEINDKGITIDFSNPFKD